MRLMTEGEFAREARLSRATLWRLRRAGKLSHVQIGGRIRYTTDHLRELIETHERPATSDINEGRLESNA